MTAYTSTTSGAWSAAIWSPAGTPGAGDTVTIAHAVAVAASATIGAGGTASACLTIQDGAALTVNAGVELTVQGHAVLRDAAATTAANDRLILAAGATLTFAVPAGQTYYLYLADASNQSGRLRCNGSAGSRCTVRRTGSGVAAISYNSGSGGCILATFTDFTNLGSASTPALWFNLVSDHACFRIELSDCTFSGGGQIKCNAGIAGSTTFTLDRVTLTGTLQSYCFDVIAGAAGSGTRRLAGCAFDRWLKLLSPAGFTITEDYFADGAEFTAGTWAEFSGNLYRKTYNSFDNVYADVVDSYILFDHNLGNPHGFSTGGTAVTLDGCVFEYTGTSGDGDIIAPGATTTTLRRCIVLPNGATPTADQSGKLLACLGAAGVSASVEHCTGVGGNQGLIGIGETYAGHVDLLTSARANLVWDFAGTARGYKVFDGSSGNSIADFVHAANCDYNAGWHLATGSNGPGYDLLDFSTGTPGVHDLNGVDPGFADPTRDLAGWDGSLGGPGTVAGALARLRADPTLTVGSLLPWVRAGFVPTNPAYSAATYPGDPLTTDAAGAALGGTIGALAYAAAGSPLAAGTTSAAAIAGRTVRCTVSGTAATGGTAPYVYRVQYALDAAGSPGTWAYYGLYGAAETLAAGVDPADVEADGLAPGRTYHWRHEVTDSAGTPATATATPDALAQPASDLANIDLWWAHLTSLLTHNSILPRLTTLPDPMTSGGYDANGDMNHDGIAAALRGLRARPGDPDLTAYLYHQRRLNLFYDSNETGTYPGGTGNINPIFYYPEGLALAWEWTGDVEARDTLEFVARHTPILEPGYGQPGNMHENGSREVAYLLQACVEAERLGLLDWAECRPGWEPLSYGVRVGELVDDALAHIDQWCGDPNDWNGGLFGYIQPWMSGLTGYALAVYLDHLEAAHATTDARIVPALCRAGVRLREGTWTPGVGWPLRLYPDGTTSEAAAIENLLAAGFLGWLYRRTGDPYWVTAGDEAFNPLMELDWTTGVDFSKQFNEIYRYSHIYLDWRESPPAVPDDQHVILDPPTFPAVVLGSGSLTYSVKPVAAFTGTITPADGGAGGSFAPTSLTWSGTRELKTLAYTPATAGDHTISVSGYAPLACPAPTALARVLDPAGLATGFTLVGPSSGPVGDWSDPFTITPSGSFCGHIYVDDGSIWADGTFDNSLGLYAWAGPPTPRTFSYKRAAAGTSTINFTADTGFGPPVYVLPPDPAAPTPLAYTAPPPGAGPAGRPRLRILTAAGVLRIAAG